MSSFTCNKCDTRIIDSDKGYITECEHYPLEDKRSAPVLVIGSPSTGWQDMAPALPKGEPMPMTEPYFRKHLAMVDELVMEQKAEISKLKETVNDLRNKRGSENKHYITTVVQARGRIMELKSKINDLQNKLKNNTHDNGVVDYG